MNKFIQSSKALDSPDLKQFAASLVTNSLPSLTVSPQNFSHTGALIEIVVHTAALLLCGQNRILEPLRSLAFSPATMQVRKLVYTELSLASYIRTLKPGLRFRQYVLVLAESMLEPLSCCLLTLQNLSFH